MGLVRVGRFTDFLEFCLYAVHRGHSTVTASELARVGRWSRKRPASIGVAMLRYMAKLDGSGVRDFVHSVGGATVAWRLAVPEDRIRFVPSREECLAWIRRRIDLVPELVDDLPHGALRWLPLVVDGLIAVERGEIEAGLTSFRDARTMGRTGGLLRAVSELLVERFVGRSGEELREELQALWNHPGPIGEALRARAFAAREVRQHGEPLQALTLLEEQLAALRALPDLDGLGVTYNTLAVVARRAEQYERAARYAALASVMLVTTQNLPVLQAAIFNLGHSWYQSGSEERVRQSLAMVALDRRIAAEFRLGFDSAQAELLAGTIHVQLSEFASARDWLKRARSISRRTGNSFDAGGTLLLEARMRWNSALARGAESEERFTALGLLQRARLTFEQAGVATTFLDAEVRAIESGRAIRLGVCQPEQKRRGR